MPDLPPWEVTALPGENAGRKLGSLTQGDEMRIRTRHFLTGVLAVLFLATAAPALAAQQDEAGVTEMIRLEVAPDQQDAFESGVQAHHETVRAQGVERPVIIWQVVTGKHSGDYYVGFVGRSWADFDQPMGDDPEALQQSVAENITPHVKDYHTTFWQHRPDLSYQPGAGGEGLDPDPMMTVTFYDVKDNGAFMDAARQIREAAEQADYEGGTWEAHQLEYGGGSVMAIVSGRDDFADLAQPETTLWDVLSEQKSDYEMDAFEKQLDKAIDSARTEIFRYRADLSLLPGDGEM